MAPNVMDRSDIAVIAVAAAIFLGCAVSPPGLMDDADSVNATIARNMLSSGDWVTGRLNGVLYVDKAPLNYWLMAASYAVFGVHDWAARIPMALAAIALCWDYGVFRALGIFGSRRTLRRAQLGELPWIVSVYPRSHPRRSADPRRDRGALGAGACARRGRTSSVAGGRSYSAPDWVWEPSLKG